MGQSCTSDQEVARGPRGDAGPNQNGGNSKPVVNRSSDVRNNTNIHHHYDDDDGQASRGGGGGGGASSYRGLNDSFQSTGSEGGGGGGGASRISQRNGRATKAHKAWMQQQRLEQQIREAVAEIPKITIIATTPAGNENAALTVGKQYDNSGPSRQVSPQRGQQQSEGGGGGTGPWSQLTQPQPQQLSSQGQPQSQSQRQGQGTQQQQVAPPPNTQQQQQLRNLVLQVQQQQRVLQQLRSTSPARAPSSPVRIVSISEPPSPQHPRQQPTFAAVNQQQQPQQNQQLRRQPEQQLQNQNRPPLQGAPPQHQPQQKQLHIPQQRVLGQTSLDQFRQQHPPTAAPSVRDSLHNTSGTPLLSNSSHNQHQQQIIISSGVEKLHRLVDSTKLLDLRLLEENETTDRKFSEAAHMRIIMSYFDDFQEGVDAIRQAAATRRMLLQRESFTPGSDGRSKNQDPNPKRRDHYYCGDVAVADGDVVLVDEEAAGGRFSTNTTPYESFTKTRAPSQMLPGQEDSVTAIDPHLLSKKYNNDDEHLIRSVSSSRGSFSPRRVPPPPPAPSVRPTSSASQASQKDNRSSGRVGSPRRAAPPPPGPTARPNATPDNRGGEVRAPLRRPLDPVELQSPTAAGAGGLTPGSRVHSSRSRSPPGTTTTTKDATPGDWARERQALLDRKEEEEAAAKKSAWYRQGKRFHEEQRNVLENGEDSRRQSIAHRQSIEHAEIVRKSSASTAVDYGASVTKRINEQKRLMEESKERYGFAVEHQHPASTTSDGSRPTTPGKTVGGPPSRPAPGIPKQVSTTPKRAAPPPPPGAGLNDSTTWLDSSRNSGHHHVSRSYSNTHYEAEGSATRRVVNSGGGSARGHN